MVAGEASGDVLAGLLLHALKQRWSPLDAFGIGGPHMAKEGFDAWWPHHKLAVHGLGWDVLMRYREITGIRGALFKRLSLEPPSVFVGVDAPDFNLALEARLRERGVKTVQFVCPSVWAWRAERLPRIKNSADHVLCLFPFEPALLAKHGVHARYVGHPLAQVIPMKPDKSAARLRLGLTEDEQVLALLPGSRASEIRHLAALFFEVAARIKRARPGVKFLVPVVPGLEPLIQAALHASGMVASIQCVVGQSHAVLAACDATLIASGTATLEAALFKRPMVIAYRMSALSWQWIRRKRLQAWVGLPNILCADFVVPEFLQEQATVENLAQASMRWLDCAQDDPQSLERLESRFADLHTTLLRDTGALAAQAIENVLYA